VSAIETYGNSLRVCGSCSAWLLTVDADTPTVHCNKCRAAQPDWNTWAAALRPNDLVFLYPYAAWRRLSRSRYLIVARDGDQLTVQVLGIPDSRMTVHISTCTQQDVTPWRAEGALY
jgi:hypothetical protein